MNLVSAVAEDVLVPLKTEVIPVSADVQVMSMLEFPHKGQMMSNFDVFLVVSPKKPLIKQLICQ